MGCFFYFKPLNRKALMYVFTWKVTNVSYLYKKVGELLSDDNATCDSDDSSLSVIGKVKRLFIDRFPCVKG